MVERRLSRFGVGPIIAVPSLAYTIAALWAGSKWPEIFIVAGLPQFVRVIGGILMILGVALWLTGVNTVMRAYNRDELVTWGVFGLVRHPVYAGWISLGMPGFALVMRSWPMLLTPLIAYAMFKSLIHKEDEYLEKRFGQPYLDYRRNVNEVLPIPRLGSRRVHAGPPRML